MTDGRPDVSALYRGVILDHGRAPRRAALPAPCDRTRRGDNPLCGDRVTVGVRLSDAAGELAIGDIGCQARGCAISVAAASVMACAVAGARAAEVCAMWRAFEALVRGEPLPPGADLRGAAGDLTAFTAVAAFPQRIQCATLPWDTLRALLADPAR